MWLAPMPPVQMVASIEGDDSDLGVFRAALGDVYPAFCVRVLAADRNEFKGKRATADPWGAGTLEWSTGSPPRAGCTPATPCRSPSCSTPATGRS